MDCLSPIISKYTSHIQFDKPIIKQLMSQANNKQQLNLLYSLINGTGFHSFIKNKLGISFVSPTDIKDVMADNYMILRAHKKRMEEEEVLEQEDQAVKKSEFEKTLHFDPRDSVFRLKSNNPTIIVVVYGEIAFQDKLYGKGKYFLVEQLNPQKSEVSINFLKPSTIIEINYEILLHRIDYIKHLNYKIHQLEICFPTNKLKLTKSQIKKIAAKMEVYSIAKGAQVKLSNKAGKQAGIFVLIEGVFDVCYLISEREKKELMIESNSHEIPVYQLEHNYFYDDGKTGKYRINLKSYETGKFGYFSVSTLQGLLDGVAVISTLRSIHNNRMILQDNIQRAKQIECERCKNQKLLAKKVQQMKKLDSKQLHNKQRSLYHTRSIMLTKSTPTFSTPSPKKKSVQSPTSKTYSLTKSRYHTSQSQAWSSRNNRTNNVQKLNFESTYDRTLEMSVNKLDKMRRYQSLKGITKKKSKLWMNDLDLKEAQQKTFYEIKQMKTSRDSNKYLNLKRTFMNTDRGRLKKPFCFTDK